VGKESGSVRPNISLVVSAIESSVIVHNVRVGYQHTKPLKRLSKV